MVDINTFLLMLVYLLGMILLVCSIVMVTKLITTIERINRILDEVDTKLAKFDKTFQIVDVVTDSMAMVSDKLVDGISNLIRRFFYNRKKEREEEDIYE